MARLPFWLSAVLALVLLLTARLYLLPQVGLLDYDSVFNWQVVQEVSQGDFTHLFHHRSPSFFLFYGALARLLPDFHWFVYLNALLNAVAALVLASLARHRLQLSAGQWLLLALTIGLSVFYVHTARYFTVESPALLLFALFLRQYLLRTEQQQARYLYGALAWLALGLTFNYKFLLVVPVLLVTEGLQEQPLLRGRTLRNAVLLMGLPLVLYSLLALLAGLPVYRYLASFSGLVQFDRPNPALRTGKFQSDLSFYFRYLLQFESPVAWLGVLGAGAMVWQRVGQRLRGQLQWPEVLAVFCLLFLGGMSLLLKAPRGLVFIYGLLYLLGVTALWRLLNRPLLRTGLLLAGLSYSVYRCYTAIYRYSDSSYPALAAWLQQHRVPLVATTAGMGLVPYLQGTGVATITLVRPEDVRKLQKYQIRYLLLDDYYRVTHLQHFQAFEQLPALLSWPEPTLRSPLLYLEHAEFTGYGYRQTLQLREEALRDSVQLRLIRLPE